MNNNIYKFKEKFKEIILNEDRRLKTQYLAVYIMLGLVALFMSIVNIITGEVHLLIATGIFSVLCFANLILGVINEKTLKISSYFFIVEFLILFVYFIVSGHPDGFSCIWLAMLPTAGMILFKKKWGSVISLIAFGLLVFFFDCPFGNTLLSNPSVYTETFMLRFPMLYMAFFFISLFFEIMFELTYDSYKKLFTHDALTGMLNRIGFGDYIEKNSVNGEYVTFLMFDLDNFKNVNDTYGHLVGDEVLKEASRRLDELLSVPVCRWGGEEFAAFIPGDSITNKECDEIVRKFQEKPMEIDDLKLNITVSMGAVVMKNQNNVTMPSVCNSADECLYKAKEEGKNRAVFKKYSE